MFPPDGDTAALVFIRSAGLGLKQVSEEMSQGLACQLLCLIRQQIEHSSKEELIAK